MASILTMECIMLDMYYDIEMYQQGCEELLKQAIAEAWYEAAYELRMAEDEKALYLEGAL